MKNSFKITALCVLSLALFSSCNASERELRNAGTRATVKKAPNHKELKRSYEVGKSCAIGGFALFAIANWSLIARNYIMNNPYSHCDVMGDLFDASAVLVGGIGGGLMACGAVKCNEATAELMRMHQQKAKSR